MGMKIKGILILAILVGCIVGVLPTFKAYSPGNDPALVKNKVNLGLDLQGGMYLDLEVDTKAAVSRIMDRLLVEIEDAMLDELINYVSVERKTEGIEIILASGEKADWNASPFDRMLTGYTLQQVESQHYLVSLPAEEMERIEKNATTQALEVIRNRIDSLGVSEPSIQKKGEREIIVQLPGLRDRESALKTIGTPAVLEFYLVASNVTPDTMNPTRHIIKYMEERDKTTQKLISRDPYVLEKHPVMSGESIRKATMGFGSFNDPIVNFTLNSQGADRFAKVTSNNRGRNLAIVLDDKVRSAPVIREAITAGSGQISGGFSEKEATQLAIVLTSGSLPAPLDIREERTVGASLGEDSIRQGVLSLLIGGVLVLGFMTFYYRISGTFACFALIFNLLIITAVLAYFQATLTLPGIAGIVLTMGMSVDANVLIFERIREELKVAKNARAAINEGFQKAFWTIFDANITTLVAALALLFFGTGPIKGFAVTLSIGILASMFTAIFVTRFLFELVYLNRRRLVEVSV